MKTRCLLLVTFTIFLFGCKTSPKNELTQRTRYVVDTVGFAHKAWQVDSIINRINSLQSSELNRAKVSPDISWRAAICPHDDYTYVGWHYPAVLKNIKAKTIIIFGVAHKAKKFSLADKIVFENFDNWQGITGNIQVSNLRNELTDKLPKDFFTVHDSMHIVEHSIESMLPFLQYYNPDIQIIPILVPYMPFDRMKEISKELAKVISLSMDKHKMEWGSDLAILITTDAVHYGDEQWGGKNYAPFGVDSVGYQKAVTFEHEIISNCLEGELSESRIQRFFEYTVNPNDYKEYQWTWCGRYSVPMGLLTVLQLNQQLGTQTLNGQFIGYTTSIDHNPIPVDDLGLGRTAIANQRHWVGYASVGFE